jgi:PIN domain nuclease of toxin-antitoxin system
LPVDVYTFQLQPVPAEAKLQPGAIGASLSVKARRAISSETSTCFLSVASVWAMAIKAALGKLNLAVSVEEFVSTHVAANNFKSLDVSFRHAARAEKLSSLHSDPFDRLLIVQAQTEDL